MAKLNKKIGNTNPGKITIIVSADNKYEYVSINNRVEMLSDNTWTWDALELPEFAFDAIHAADDDTKYKVLLTHVVKAYYDDNDEMAVLANYLSDPTKEKYKSEFAELQKCRAEAKILASFIVNNRLF